MVTRREGSPPFEQVTDSRLGELESSQAVLDAFPETVLLFFSVREIDLGGKFGELLVFDGVEVPVVPLDDLLLVWGVVRHGQGPGLPVAGQS